MISGDQRFPLNLESLSFADTLIKAFNGLDRSLKVRCQNHIAVGVITNNEIIGLIVWHL